MCSLTCLALVLELHHPLPGPGEGVGPDWAAAALQCYWPMLRGLCALRECLGRVADPGGQPELDGSGGRSRPGPPSLDELESTRGEKAGAARACTSSSSIAGTGTRSPWSGIWRESGAVDLIPTTSSHTWLPSVADDPVVARAQVKLAAADHAVARGGGPRASGCPFSAICPGLESTLGEAGLRFFGVGGGEFLRGTVLPPDQLFAPMITPPGVAVFGVDPEPTLRVVDPSSGYGRDPRYLDSAGTARAAARHAEDFLESWRQLPRSRPPVRRGAAEPISVVALSAHDLMRCWPGGTGGRLAGTGPLAAARAGRGHGHLPL